jgi:ketosteroid isomerase-like protein
VSPGTNVSPVEGARASGDRGEDRSASPPGTAGSAKGAARWAAAFEEGWRAPRDADSFADHFDPLLADDVRLVQPQVPATVGREAFREQFARPVFALIPDLRAVVEEWAETETGLMISFRLEGTVGGRAVSWPCVDRVTLRDGVATERVAHFDPLVLLGAVALAPRSWPRFARIQMSTLLNRIGGRS